MQFAIRNIFTEILKHSSGMQISIPESGALTLRDRNNRLSTTLNAYPYWESSSKICGIASDE